MMIPKNRKGLHVMEFRFQLFMNVTRTKGRQNAHLTEILVSTHFNCINETQWDHNHFA